MGGRPPLFWPWVSNYPILAKGWFKLPLMASQEMAEPSQSQNGGCQTTLKRPKKIKIKIEGWPLEVVQPPPNGHKGKEKKYRVGLLGWPQTGWPGWLKASLFLSWDGRLPPFWLWRRLDHPLAGHRSHPLAKKGVGGPTLWLKNGDGLPLQFFLFIYIYKVFVFILCVIESISIICNT